MNDGPSVLPRMYELPHLFGVWLLDPEYQAALERATGETIHPAANVFLPYHFAQVNLEPDGSARGTPVTTARFMAYRLEGPEMYIAPLLESKDGNLSVGEQTPVPWAITDDLRLNLSIGEQWWRFVPSTIDELIQAGFDVAVLESVIEMAEESGFEVHGRFDLSKADELIANADN